MREALFRQQATDHQTNRLHGVVLVTPTLSHMLMVVFIVLWVCALAVWLINSSYARKEMVGGWLEPQTGLIRVMSPDTQGRIAQVFVHEGETVTRGMPLLSIGNDNYIDDGESLQSQLLRGYEAQQQILQQKLTSLDSIHHISMQELDNQILTAEQDMSKLETQIATTLERQNLVERQAENYRDIKARGHLSNLELDATLERRLTIKNQMQALLREKLKQQAQLDALVLKTELLPQQFKMEHMNISARLNEVQQLAARTRAQQSQLIRAAQAGKVTNLQANVGQPITPNQPLLTLVPAQDPIQAKLLVPVSAAGFVESGQTINLRYDAFPFQKFGMYSARIVSVSDSVLLPQEVYQSPVPIKQPAYLVIAQLDADSVNAYGKAIPLKTGMTFSADILLGERTLLEWLLEPIISMEGSL